MDGAQRDDCIVRGADARGDGREPETFPNRLARGPVGGR